MVNEIYWNGIFNGIYLYNMVIFHSHVRSMLGYPHNPKLYIRDLMNLPLLVGGLKHFFLIFLSWAFHNTD